VVGAEQDLVTKDKRTISWAGGVTVPLTPPPSTGITGGAVSRVAAEKVNNISTIGVTVCGCRVKKAGVKFDGNKVPAGS
jgi:hypothetical protein